MVGWKEWIGKKVFIRTKQGKVYSGYVTEVNDADPLLIFLTINDKFHKKVMFLSSELIELKEEF